jgi:hypothetical protein
MTGAATTKARAGVAPWADCPFIANLVLFACPAQPEFVMVRIISPPQAAQKRNPLQKKFRKHKCLGFHKNILNAKEKIYENAEGNGAYNV